MSNYVFIADSFYEDGYHGGAEVCNFELIKRLRNNGHNVVQIYSFFASPELIDSCNADVFIVGNFLGLTEESKRYFIQNKILFYLWEHDHKYLSTRDPSVFINNIASKDQIINFDFYKNAYKVVGQSQRHVNIMKSNLGLDNIVQGYNLWSAEHIKNLVDNSLNEKKYDAAVMGHVFQQKNTEGAIKYCEENGLKYNLIPFGTKHADFCRELSLCRNLVFFPMVNETLSRVSVEAYCLNTELITNNNISFLDESWSNLRGLELISFLEEAAKKTLKIFEL